MHGMVVLGKWSRGVQGRDVWMDRYLTTHDLMISTLIFSHSFYRSRCVKCGETHVVTSEVSVITGQPNLGYEACKTRTSGQVPRFMS